MLLPFVAWTGTRLVGLFLYLVAAALASGGVRAAPPPDFAKCQAQFFDEMKSGLEEAGGAVGSSDASGMSVWIIPAGGQIQRITIDFLVDPCARPGLVFDIEGDEIEIGALRGVETVARSVFLQSAASEQDLDDLYSLGKLVRACMNKRPQTYDDDTFSRQGSVANRSITLDCTTKATASGVPMTYLSFDRDPSTLKQQSAN